MTAAAVPVHVESDERPAMLGRSRTVLSRFPAHMDAMRPGKQLQVVADAIATGLDDLSASLAAVRRSHRLAHADATSDLLLLAALHRIGTTELAPLDGRLARLRLAAHDLRQATDAHDDAARDAASETLCDLLGIAAAPPRLALFAPPPPQDALPAPPLDLNAATAVLLAAVDGLVSDEGRRETIRARIASLCRIHARGNGTVRTLLEGAASALDLELDDGRAAAFKEAFRPVVSVTTQGAPGTTRYAYVVIARSRSKNVDRVSAVASIATGNAALNATDCNILTWPSPADARDFLVFRVFNGAAAAAVGLLTPTALAATTTTFRDTGIAPADPRLPDAEVDDALFHSRDGFWHAAFIRERNPLIPGIGSSEIIGIEENPVRRESTPDTPRTHAELFHVYRRGFGRSLLQVHISGVGHRTIGPMLVNRDECIGIGFAGKVADGERLVFDEEGHVTLDGADVTANAFGWTGACFAANDDDPAAPHDRVFDGPGVDPARRATFAVATPFDALDGAFDFPHAGDPIPMPGIGIGATRFAFFVREAHFAAMDLSVLPNVVVALSPRTHGGILDESVFATPPDSAQQPAAKVNLSWLEHEAYALRLLLPRRFSQFDSPGEPPLAELVKRALERHRPAGVDVSVTNIEDRWILGESDVTAADAADPILSLRGGSVLWAPPTAPTP
ncbi:MAG: hypothetical protein ACT4P7_15660 [Gemmatimonadaceae bacterium]